MFDTASFDSLPAELIDQIARLVDPEDLFSLRLVGRHFNASTFTHFAKTHFATFVTDLSRESLQMLQGIAEIDALRTHVRTLSFSEGVEEDVKLGQGFEWDRHPSGRLSDPILQFPAVQTLRDLLLHKLVNCRSFWVYNNESEDELFTETLGATDVIAIIFAIIAETGLPIKSFHVTYFGRKSNPLRVSPKRLPLERCQTAEFRAAWAHLQLLQLNQAIMADAIDWSVELIVHASALRTLDLSMSYMDDGLELLRRLSSVDELPKLHELKLSTVRLEEDVIVRILRRLGDSLKVVSFRFCSVEGVRRRGRPTWCKIFQTLRQDCPLLEDIDVFYLSKWYRGRILTLTLAPEISEDEKNVVVPGSRGKKLVLSQRKHKDMRPNVWGATYSGPRVDKALKILERFMAEQTDEDRKSDEEEWEGEWE